MSLLSRFVLVSCLLIHAQYFLANHWVVHLLRGRLPFYHSIFQGLSYLLYPLCGWIVGIHGNGFTMIKLSFWAMLVSSLFMLATALSELLYPGRFVADKFSILYVVTGICGLGFFEANAIQFGMDQMLEASSEQLADFVHWYSCFVNMGPLVHYYFLVASFVYVSHCKIQLHDLSRNLYQYLSFFAIFPAGLQFVISFIWLSFVYPRNQYFNERIQRVSKNPLKIIYKVLQYSYQHKYPERRSAFTYWENDIPSRINLGKEKYGGPFTYEQVEDVKTVLRLLLLMVSVFGFHLSGDGFSFSNYVMATTGCPKLVPFLLLFINPLHFPMLIGVIAVPLYQLVKVRIKRFVPGLLFRIQIGLFICLLNEAVQCWCGLALPRYNLECFDSMDMQSSSTLFKTCMVTGFELVGDNGTCSRPCDVIEPGGIAGYSLYLSVIPFCLYGLSNLIVFLTMLEFICAQSPNAMKGVLIGLWYSLLSIKYLVINVIDELTVLRSSNPWFIYHGVKGVFILASLIVFWRVRKRYCYRERNEIVNEQGMIEEQYERELFLNNGSSSTSSDDEEEIVHVYTVINLL